MNGNDNKGEQRGTPVEETIGDGGDKGTSFGPLSGVAIIVILILLGGVYLWYSSTSEKEGDAMKDDAMATEEPVGEMDPVVEGLGSQSSSDELGDIESDLDTTGLDDLDADLENIDAELNF